MPRKNNSIKTRREFKMKLKFIELWNDGKRRDVIYHTMQDEFNLSKESIKKIIGSTRVLEKTTITQLERKYKSVKNLN